MHKVRHKPFDTTADCSRLNFVQLKGLKGDTGAAGPAGADGDLTAASIAETNTGTITNKGVTPDSLAGSYAGTKTIVIKVIANDTALTVADNLNNNRFVIPEELDGMNLVSVGAHVFTASTSGLPSVQIRNFTDSVDMLSTNITIDANEKDSSSAATAAVINAANDDVVEGDELQIDVDVAGTGTLGLEVRLGFRLP